MTCCVCKVNPKFAELQVCAVCARAFAAHINQPAPKPFLDPPAPKPTPDIRGKGPQRDGDRRGAKIKKKQAIVNAKSMHAK